MYECVHVPLGLGQPARSDQIRCDEIQNEGGRGRGWISRFKVHKKMMTIIKKNVNGT